ncbi:hypothetical protein CHUAL_001365 [Chamberlinius hualienensis]
MRAPGSQNGANEDFLKLEFYHGAEKSMPNLYNSQTVKWLAVVHPLLVHRHYVSNTNRRNLTSQEIIDEVAHNIHNMSHRDLLDRAVNENITKGYWMIFCNDDESFDRCWAKLVQEFYHDEKLNYSRIECQWENDRKIFIFNDDFSHQESVGTLANKCRSVLQQLGIHKSLYYKPAFYTDVGLRYDTTPSHLRYPYIYRSNTDLRTSDYDRRVTRVESSQETSIPERKNFTMEPTNSCSTCRSANWSDTRFFCPDIISFLQNYRPSKYLQLSPPVEWLAVANPALDHRDFASQPNRQGQTSDTILNEIKANLKQMSHKNLLELAVSENITKGYWMIFCNDDESFDTCWEKLVQEFYYDVSLNYLRIECRLKKNKGDQGGIICIINHDFRDQDCVRSLANKCRLVLQQLDFSMQFYYKPSLYTDIGLRYETTTANLAHSYIYRSDTEHMSVDYELVDGVGDFFNANKY